MYRRADLPPVRQKSYTMTEDALLKKLWLSDMKVGEIKTHFPDRTKLSIINRAHRLKLSKRPNCVLSTKPRVAKEPIARFCANLECNAEITGIGGHRDRVYCNLSCAGVVQRARESLMRDLKPSRRVKDKPCDHFSFNDGQWLACKFMRLTPLRFCYTHGADTVEDNRYA